MKNVLFTIALICLYGYSKAGQSKLFPVEIKNDTASAFYSLVIDSIGRHAYIDFSPATGVDRYSQKYLIDENGKLLTVSLPRTGC